jgi:hypothetical protein
MIREGNEVSGWGGVLARSCIVMVCLSKFMIPKLYSLRWAVLVVADLQATLDRIPT